jgi:hypothetical protein
MKASELIKKFSESFKLPVEIDTVINFMRDEMGVTDEIYPFWDIEMDVGTLQGYFHREEIPNGDSSYYITTIGYAKSGHEMERLVACKELLHVLDPQKCRVASAEKVYALISKMALRADLIEPFSQKDHASDRVAALEALAVLFPLAARNYLLPFHNAGELSLAEIAELAELPESYVAYALSDAWPDIHEVLLRGREHRENHDGE